MALDFAAGCAGGAAGILVGFPLDTVKVRIQTQDPSRGGLKYTGTFQCFSSIVKNEGGKALYRGMSSPILGVAAINAICFGVYGNVNRRLANPESLRSVTVAGMASGFVQAFVCSPIELVKTQMQVRSDCNSVSETLRSIINQNGLRGLTRGLGITVCREVPAFGLYFSSYEVLVRNRKHSSAWVFTAGGISGIVSWIFTYPQDVIKSRLQADNFGAAAKYKNVVHCFRSSVMNDGFNVLFRGIGSTIVRAFPVNAATMSVVTLCISYFSDEEEFNPYDAMKRLRMAESMHVNFPPAVENYFQQRIGYNCTYHHNVCTMATDGPSIIHIATPELSFSPSRVYVENMLFATPSRHHEVDEEEVHVGTMRSDVSLSVIHRILERKINKINKRRKSNSGDDMLWTPEKAFNNKTCDFMIDSGGSGQPFTVISREAEIEEEKKAEDETEPKQPSLLVRLPSRTEVITTADLLQPTSLVTTNEENKIYGFYYLV